MISSVLLSAESFCVIVGRCATRRLRHMQDVSFAANKLISVEENEGLSTKVMVVELGVDFFFFLRR